MLTTQYSTALWREVSDFWIAELRRENRPNFFLQSEPISTWRWRYVIGLDWLIMPRKSGRTAHTPAPAASQETAKTTWLNIPLEPEDIEHVIELAESTREFGDEVTRLIATGGNFSVRFEPQYNNYKCYLSDTRAGGSIGGLSLSAKANTPQHAVASAIIKLRKYLASPAGYTGTGSSLGIG